MLRRLLHLPAMAGIQVLYVSHEHVRLFYERNIDLNFCADNSLNTGRYGQHCYCFENLFDSGIVEGE